MKVPVRPLLVSVALAAVVCAGVSMSAQAPT